MIKLRVTVPLLCGKPTEAYGWGTCRRLAGDRTNHPGWGPCRTHGGATAAAERAWEVAMRLAVELDINPMEALLWSVRIAAGKVYQLEQALEFAEWRGDVAGHAKALDQSRDERKELRTAAKAAIDAGIAATIVRNRELEGQLLGSALAAALEAAGCTPEQRTKALEAAQGHLLGVAQQPSMGDAKNVVLGEVLSNGREYR